MPYDVIIAGAGPAGAAAAYWLGEAGSRVAVLEKESLPRDKPCGGGVPKAVFDRFPFDFREVVERWVHQVRFRYRDGREVLADLPQRSVAMVMRDVFDLHILRHSAAEVRDRTEVTAVNQDESGVTVTTASGQRIQARYLIGADGANSRVAQSLGLRHDRRMGVAIEAEVPVDARLLETYGQTALFVFGTPSRGYVWVFPKARHLSIGIGSFKKPGRNLKRALQGEMVKLGIPMEGVRLKGHPLPAHDKREPLQKGRVLLVGDAAGLLDPLLGEGIRHAVDSGRLAAEALLHDELERYSRRVHRLIGQDLLWGKRLAGLFYSFPRASFELAVRNPFFMKSFLRLFAGEISYRRLALTALTNTVRGLPKRLAYTR